MVRIENIESKLQALKRYLDILEHYRKLKFESIEADPHMRGALERYLYLACQASIDIAEMVIKLKKLGKSDSMSESFDALKQAGMISSGLALKLQKMVGFRNALSHGYEHLNYSIVKDVLMQGVLDLHEFYKSISAKL